MTRPGERAAAHDADRPLRVVFCGTPEFAVPSLRAIVEHGCEVPLVVSQPDRVRGRRGRPEPSPVRETALGLGIDTAVLERGREARETLYARILALRPDVVVVVAFGHIVREPLLSAPPLGCVNVHASLLPRWRGPAPVHTAIVAGDATSGVCTMRLAAGVDTGDVYLREETPIGSDETAGELVERLADLGARLLPRTLDGLRAGVIEPRPQDETFATHAPLLAKQEGSVDFATSARAVHDRIRGLDPWPATTVLCRERPLKLSRSTEPRSEPVDAAPGTVLAIEDDGMRVACAGGSVRIRSVQAQGKRAMTPAEYARGHALAVGDRLTPLAEYEPKEPRR